MARAFSGTSQYLTLAAAPTTSSTLTLSGRFWIDSASVSAVLFSLGTNNSANNRRYLTYVTTDTTFRATSVNNAGTSASASVSASGLLDQWVTLVGTWNGATFRGLSVNGAATVSDTTSISPNAPNHVRVSGNHITIPAGLLTGRAAELGMWDAVLNDAESASLAAGLVPLAIRRASLVASWPLLGRTSPEMDLKDAGANLTVTSATTIEHPRIYMPRSRGAIVRSVVVAAPKRYLLVRN